MENLLTYINRLQDAFSKAGLPSIDLPQIAVVGSQSSGKSSVLESIIGKDFLPRGSGIVTRRPLVLQLIYTPTSAVDYAEFLHLPNKRFDDFNAVCKEIEDDTDRVCGRNAALSNRPISLKVFSPNVVNLTLIDLPGMTRYAVGEQVPDVEQQIKNMILEFITSPNCLILAVSAANTDLANSDALALARSVDPHYDRTIGVLTKLDLMDEGTNALDILCGKLVPLKHGFVGVVNRSQKEIDTKKTMAMAREKEREFFVKHPQYSTIAERMGTQYLTEKLSKTLLQHISRCLPEMKDNLNKRLQEEERNFTKRFGCTVDELMERLNNKQMQRSRAMNMTNQFASDLASQIAGTSTRVSFTKLTGSARIKYIFNEIFGGSLRKLSNVGERITDEQLMTAISNAQGLGTDAFISSAAMVAILSGLIDLLREPSMQCLDMVAQELEQMVVESAASTMPDCPVLQKHAVDNVVRAIRQLVEPTRMRILELISCQRAYINTNHPFFPMARVQQDSDEQADTRADNIAKGKEVATDVRFEGFLRKMGSTNMFGRREWIERYVVVVNNAFSYYANKGDTVPRRTFNLAGCKVRACTERDQSGREWPAMEVSRDDGFLYGNKSVLLLMARDATDCELWITRLAQATRKMDKEHAVVQHVKQENRSRDENPLAYLQVQLKPVTQDLFANDMTSNNTHRGREIILVRNVFTRYFNLILLTHEDMAPKMITQCLIEELKNQVHARILERFMEMSDQQLDEMFSTQRQADEADRDSLCSRISIIKEALKALNSI